MSMSSASLECETWTLEAVACQNVLLVIRGVTN
jgi:hypothetical protein